MSAANRKGAGMQNIRRVPKLPVRRSDAHKGDFGTVVVLAGSQEMLGAAVLCARAATRGGAGLVRVGLPSELVSLLPLSVPEATTFAVRGSSWTSQLEQADAVVVGPGLTQTAPIRQLVRRVLRVSPVPVVLDADALNVLAPLANGLPSHRAPVLLTPHPGEAARLLGVATGDVQADRPGAVRELCERSGGIVVLKGAGTLVCDGARCFANRTGNPGMASGGSGDVLSGLLGALLARGMEPFDAACLAVHVHGRAGDRAREDIGETGMVASDTIDAIAKELP